MKVLDGWPDSDRLLEKRTLTYWTCYCIYHAHPTKEKAEKCILETNEKERADKERNRARLRAYRNRAD